MTSSLSKYDPTITLLFLSWNVKCYQLFESLPFLLLPLMLVFEHGRVDVDVESRLCQRYEPSTGSVRQPGSTEHCHTEKVETEEHFLLHCPKYDN